MDIPLCPLHRGVYIYLLYTKVSRVVDVVSISNASKVSYMLYIAFDITQNQFP